MRVLSTFEEVAAAEGVLLGTGDWLAIEQERIDGFASATDDHQWIHVDVERAHAGPFGAPIAHGFLTLSLIPALGSSIFTFATPGPKLNYGLNNVRFPSPVKVGQRVRDQVTVLKVEDASRGVQVTLQHVIEVEGQAKPACVAEMLVLLIN